MKIYDCAGIISLLFVVGAAFTIKLGSDITSLRRGNSILLCELSDAQYIVRRNFLNQTLMMGVACMVGVQPTFAATGSTVTDGVMAPTKNKMLGGLAHKIQAVGQVLVSQ
jgi:hypothetical protein